MAENFGQLQDYFDDPRYTFVVHNAQAEWKFCKAVGLRFPKQHFDTFLAAVMILHASAFNLVGGVYKHASLASMMARHHLPFIASDEKDEIRDAILRNEHVEKFGMERVLEYCMGDAKAVLALGSPVQKEFHRICGPYAERNLAEIYQPYSIAMAEASWRGLRLDQNNWERLTKVAPVYRRQRVGIMRQFGYDHDGEGIGGLGFQKMIRQIGLERDWKRTEKGHFSTQDIELESFRDHPAINAALEMKRFDSFMNQDLGLLMDRDGQVRCNIQVLKQHTTRNSTSGPNLMGLPGEMRPLFLPDDGCVFVHFDFSQQEPGIAGWISQDQALSADFRHGDVYINLGRRLGLIKVHSSEREIKAARKLMKVLMLAILYGKFIRSVALDLGILYQQACTHMTNFHAAYADLFGWLKSYVSQSLERGWAENILGFRAGFNRQHGVNSGHLSRSCQNFPIQSSAAACFQLTGVYLDDMGCDIRLPIHDAYFLNCPNDRRIIADVRMKIMSATAMANGQLFPGLPTKRDIEVLTCFAKDGNEDSFDQWVAAVEAGTCHQN